MLLLHQIPPRPPYLRAKILRRINQLGALPIKNSAYLLPAGEEAREDLEWVRREVLESGGEAWVFGATGVAGLTDDAIREAFRELRRPDYEQLYVAAQKLAVNPSESGWRKLKRRYDEVRRIDFFDAPGHAEVEDVMRNIVRLLHQTAQKNAAPKPDLRELKGRPWVTRQGIKVDRIGSSWLIRRFLDPAAVIRFVDPVSYRHAAGEIRFDMFEGEFTHEGERCTFEVLLAWSGIADPALQAVAEVVHDIDLKDERYQRPETAGVSAMIEGLALRHHDDESRLRDGMALFDAIYERFRR
jgi:hypothetical protein